ncbi:hypothetical protein CBM2589_A90044 [Cupriavidus taiwanensis]|uniref:Uncharacterized protein n=1 Tax=Cupriavidus taiwanensis TaxID=164546 RepID=A0A375CE60_9BURK|nr:hypothetical protein CBM2589_A90044 [Cupriavidus taiwanensis]
MAGRHGDAGAVPVYGPGAGVSRPARLYPRPGGAVAEGLAQHHRAGGGGCHRRGPVRAAGRAAPVRLRAVRHRHGLPAVVQAAGAAGCGSDGTASLRGAGRARRSRRAASRADMTSAPALSRRQAANRSGGLFLHWKKHDWSVFQEARDASGPPGSDDVAQSRIHWRCRS